MTGHLRFLDIESDILTSALDKAKLATLCRFDSSYVRGEMIYSTQCHDISSGAFHRLCDDVPYTLSIIRTRCRHVFVAFASSPFNHSYLTNYISDDNAFIISFINTNMKSYRLNTRDATRSLFYSSSLGPSFGNKDLHIFLCDSELALCTLRSNVYELDTHDNDEEIDLPEFDFSLDTLEVFRLFF